MGRTPGPEGMRQPPWWSSYLILENVSEIDKYVHLSCLLRERGAWLYAGSGWVWSEVLEPLFSRV